MFDVSGIDLALVWSFALFARDHFEFPIEQFQRYFDRKEAKRLRIDDAVIQKYQNWLRTKEHSELVGKINSQQELLMQVLWEFDDLKELPERIRAFATEDSQAIRKQLSELSEAIVIPVLSKIPVHCRFIGVNQLLHREHDIARISGSTEDLVVAGQPGVGKTFLLYHYAKSTDAKFIISDNADAVVAQLRIDPTPVVIVDDAVSRKHLIERLIQLRGESGQPLRIIAVCWSFEQDDLIACMGIGKSDVHELELIAADQMAELVKTQFQASGIKVDNWLIHEIQKQAAGRPGLALRLVELLKLENNLEALRRGAVHYEILKRAFKMIGDQNAPELLAAFAVGGKGGMRRRDIGTVLGRGIGEIDKVLKTLDMGGIISVPGPDSLVTQPAAFRYALLARELLTGDVYERFDEYKELFDLAPNKNAALDTLLGSIARGAKVESDWLLQVMSQYGEKSHWNSFASISMQFCNMAISKVRDVLSITKPCLHYRPDIILPVLFADMCVDKRPPHSHPECSERQLSDWIKEQPEQHDPIKRRQTLLKHAKAWLSGGGDKDAGWKALAMCVTLDFEYHEADPGAGKSFTYGSSVLALEGAKKLTPMWSEFVELLKTVPPVDFKPIQNEMHHWLFPGRSGVATSIEYLDFTRNVVDTFLRAVIELSTVPRNALIQWGLDHGFEDLGAKDAEFSVYSPSRRDFNGKNWRESQEAGIQAALSMGRQWATRSVGEVIQRIREFETECNRLNITYPVLDREVARGIAENVSDLPVWIEAIATKELRPSFLLPFLSRLSEQDVEHTESWLINLIDFPLYGRSALYFALELEAPSESLADKCIERITGLGHDLAMSFACGHLSEFWNDWLARNAEGELALELAMADFHREEQSLLNKSRPHWLALFNRGIVNLEELDGNLFYDMDKLLAALPEVAVPIVRKLLEASPYVSSHMEQPYVKLLSILSPEDKVGLLPCLTETYPSDFTRMFVGDDLETYARILKDESFSIHCMAPLCGDPSTKEWQDKASMALEAGHEPGQIAHAALGGHWIIHGNQSTFYGGWLKKFEILLENGPRALHEVAKLGIEHFQQEVSRAKRNERKEDIYGIDN